MQDIIALAIVALAFIYLVYHTVGSCQRKKTGGCGGCTSCPVSSMDKWQKTQ